MKSKLVKTIGLKKLIRKLKEIYADNDKQDIDIFYSMANGPDIEICEVKTTDFIMCRDGKQRKGVILF